MAVIGVFNGLLREVGYRAYLSELRAHQISTVSAIALLGAYIWFAMRWWPPVSAVQALAVGALWFGMTVAFEFFFGRYVDRRSWEWLLRDYDVRAGRVWVAVPVWIAIAPYIFYRWQQH
jgi:hypothetical protein